jgi:adenylate kinase
MGASHRPAAITGTPGTGKSSIARRLGPGYDVSEVGELAVRLGVGRRVRGSVELDLARLRDRLAHRRAPPGTVYVGHLAHLLPVHDTIVLRCHPDELERRLREARRGSARDRRENATAEATDLVLQEAVSARRRVWEVDTSRRSVTDLARVVRSLLRRRPAPSYGAVRWLEDPRVTEHLLRPLR